MSIQIQNLSKKFGKNLIFDHISFEIPLGNKTALVGPNGSGKSTLLKIIMGLYQCQGKITINNESNDSRIIKESSAYVPQISPYFSSLVKDVVSTILKIRDTSLDSFEALLQRLYLDYSQIANQPFNSLSGGMKQKLMIAIALCVKPKYLYLDEPTSNLDSDSRRVFYQLCKELDPSTNLILSSHRIDEVRHLVSHVIFLENKKITFQGDLEKYFQNQTRSLFEILIKPEIQSLVEELGFTHSHSQWWYKNIFQDEKMKLVDKLREKIGSSLINLNIQDIDFKPDSP